MQIVSISSATQTEINVSSGASIITFTEDIMAFSIDLDYIEP